MNKSFAASLLLSAGLAMASAAHGEDGLDKDVLRLFGGVYATDCANPGSPHLRVSADALAVEADGRRMTGRKPLSAYSYFGQQAPPRGFRVALMSEVRPGAELRFMIFGDKAGQYARLEGEGAVAAALGKTLLAATYRDCEKRAPEPAPTGVAEPLERRAPDLLSDPAFRSAYLKALGPRARERWLARMDGPSPALRQVRVEGAEYTLVAVCKAHDCGDNNMVALYSPAGRQVFGKILEGGSRSTLIGSPSPAMAAELERLWAGEWRQNQ